jgi:hypothetical protein
MAGGSKRGGSGTGVSPLTNCRNVDLYVDLTSPKPAIEDVSEGDVLRVRVYGESVLVITEDEKPVGAISEIWTDDLIDCIEEGYSYEAEVLTLHRGTCRVNVRNRKG